MSNNFFFLFLNYNVLLKILYSSNKDSIAECLEMKKELK